MAILPNVNQNNQGMNVQQPRAGGLQQRMANLESQLTPAGGNRAIDSMAPDNGQWGGAPRYMTPQAGAMGQSVNRTSNPYSNYGQRGSMTYGANDMPNRYASISQFGGPQQTPSNQHPDQIGYNNAMQGNAMQNMYGRQAGNTMPSLTMPSAPPMSGGQPSMGNPFQTGMFNNMQDMYRSQMRALPPISFNFGQPATLPSTQNSPQPINEQPQAMPFFQPTSPPTVGRGNEFGPRLPSITPYQGPGGY